MIGLEYILKEFKTNANQLSKDLEISRYTVYDWLKERRNIPEKRLEQLSKHFNLPKEYFNKEDLKPSEKIAIQKAYIDQNAIFEEYQDYVIDDEGIEHEVTKYYSPEEDLSRHLSYVQRAEELIEEVRLLIGIEVDTHDDLYQDLFKGVIRMAKSSNNKKLKMLQDVLDFLMYADHEFGFMLQEDTRKGEKLQELFNLYK